MKKSPNETGRRNTSPNYKINVVGNKNVTNVNIKVSGSTLNKNSSHTNVTSSDTNLIMDPGLSVSHEEEIYKEIAEELDRMEEESPSNNKRKLREDDEDNEVEKKSTKKSKIEGGEEDGQQFLLHGKLVVDERDDESKEIQVSSPQKQYIDGIIKEAQEWNKTFKWKHQNIPFPILHRPKHHLEKTLDELKVEDFYLKPVYILAPHIQGKLFPRMSCPFCLIERPTLISEGPKSCSIRTILDVQDDSSLVQYVYRCKSCNSKRSASEFIHPSDLFNIGFPDLTRKNGISRRLTSSLLSLMTSSAPLYATLHDMTNERFHQYLSRKLAYHHLKGLDAAAKLHNSSFSKMDEDSGYNTALNLNYSFVRDFVNNKLDSPELEKVFKEHLEKITIPFAISIDNTFKARKKTFIYDNSDNSNRPQKLNLEENGHCFVMGATGQIIAFTATKGEQLRNDKMMKFFTEIKKRADDQNVKIKYITTDTCCNGGKFWKEIFPDATVLLDLQHMIFRLKESLKKNNNLAVQTMAYNSFCGKLANAMNNGNDKKPLEVPYFTTDNSGNEVQKSITKTIRIAMPDGKTRWENILKVIKTHVVQVEGNTFDEETLKNDTFTSKTKVVQREKEAGQASFTIFQADFFQTLFRQKYHIEHCLGEPILEGKHYYFDNKGEPHLYAGTNRNENMHMVLNNIWPKKGCNLDHANNIIKAFVFNYNQRKGTSMEKHLEGRDPRMITAGSIKYLQAFEEYDDACENEMLTNAEHMSHLSTAKGYKKVVSPEQANRWKAKKYSAKGSKGGAIHGVWTPAFKQPRVEQSLITQFTVKQSANEKRLSSVGGTETTSQIQQDLNGISDLIQPDSNGISRSNENDDYIDDFYLTSLFPANDEQAEKLVKQAQHKHVIVEQANTPEDVYNDIITFYPTLDNFTPTNKQLVFTASQDGGPTTGNRRSPRFSTESNEKSVITRKNYTPTQPSSSSSLPSTRSSPRLQMKKKGNYDVIELTDTPSPSAKVSTTDNNTRTSLLSTSTTFSTITAKASASTKSRTVSRTDNNSRPNRSYALYYPPEQSTTFTPQQKQYFNNTEQNQFLSEIRFLVDFPIAPYGVEARRNLGSKNTPRMPAVVFKVMRKNWNWNRKDERYQNCGYMHIQQLIHLPTPTMGHGLSLFNGRTVPEFSVYEWFLLMMTFRNYKYYIAQKSNYVWKDILELFNISSKFNFFRSQNIALHNNNNNSNVEENRWELYDRTGVNAQTIKDMYNNSKKKKAWFTKCEKLLDISGVGIVGSDETVKNKIISDEGRLINDLSYNQFATLFKGAFI